MENLILLTRKLNIRIIQYIFLAAIVVSIFSLWFFPNLSKIIAPVANLVQAFFYITIASQYIRNNSTATITSIAFLLGYSFLAIGAIAENQAINYLDMSYDFAYYTIKMNPYHTALNSLMLTGFLFSFNNTIDKYKTIWKLFLISYSIGLLANVVLCIFEGNTTMYSILYGLCSISATVAFVMILFEKNSNTYTYINDSNLITNARPNAFDNIEQTSEALIKLKHLYDSKILTEEEYKKAKSNLLNS